MAFGNPLRWLKRRKPGEKFPNLRRKPRSEEIWKADSGTFKHQALIPANKDLLKKVGIKPKEKVLVFAGCFGDVAQALAQECEVHYTDAGKSMTKFVRTKRPGQIRSFRTRPMQLYPRRKLVYDWSFSFEPLPLMYSANFKLTLIHSLLNRKGAIIVQQEFAKYFAEKLTTQANQVAKIYGAKLKISTTQIIEKRDDSQFGTGCQVITLETNFFARRRAALDLKVLHFLNRALKKGQEISNQELAKLAGTSLRQIEKSRERLHAIEETQQGQ
ncbi:MAG: hypothetical protein PHD95_05105 [Candidatus ainarchaeum sp.]|nr:hypothetical protein [Candidatus ainarchaeum sp.]